MKTTTRLAPLKSAARARSRSLPIAALLTLSLALLSGPPATAASERKVGFLIPSQCKSEEGVKPQPKGATDAWPAPHTTACALQPACIESGYGLWVEDRFYRFDAQSQAVALEYFRTTKRTSYNKVVATGDFGDPQSVAVHKLVPTD